MLKIVRIVILAAVIIRYTYEAVGVGNHSSTRKVSGTFLIEEEHRGKYQKVCWNSIRVYLALREM